MNSFVVFTLAALIGQQTKAASIYIDDVSEDSHAEGGAVTETDLNSLEADTEVDTDDRSLDNSYTSKKDATNKRLKIFVVRRGFSGKTLRNSDTFKTFNATSFGDCIDECQLLQCRMVSYHWGQIKSCKLSKSMVSSSQLLYSPKYETYSVAYM